MVISCLLEMYFVFLESHVRKTLIYARVSTAKQKSDLENQISLENRQVVL